jgi:hypothetical protein
MSSVYDVMIGISDDPRKTQFVLGLLAKTREGKISWAQKGNAFTATIPDGITVNLVFGLSIFGSTRYWQLFTVRDKAGNELIQVKSSDSGIAMLTVPESNSLIAATNQLFAAVSEISGDELDRAIDSLKKL